MPTTRRKQITNQSVSLWLDTQRYADRARNYTENGEWLGAYYNTLLAAIACKHYIEAHSKNSTIVPTSSSEEKNHFIVENNPLATLQKLYAAIPYYQRKVKKFQAAFACPNVQQKTDTTSTKNSLDCGSVHSIDLTTVTPIRFDDIIGNDLGKTTILDTLVYPIRMPHLYPHLARAMLFYGPPGTGKTLLAKATAHVLNSHPNAMRVLFFAPTGEAFKGKYVGESETKIVQLFQCASQQATTLETKLSKTHKKDNAPRVLSILFIDEIDSIARRRDAEGGVSSEAVVNATNTLLQMMDGIQSYPNVIVMGATNFPWNLDTAILRRFGQKVYVPLPTEAEIRTFLKHAIVNQIKASLFASITPTYFQEQKSVHDNFIRWIPLHGITEEALNVLAHQMITTSKRPGYSPRDIVRMCDMAFTREAQRVSPNAFYKVQSVSTTTTELDDSSSASNDTPGMSLIDELLRSLVNTYVSSETFTRLKQIMGKILDTTIPPVYLGNPPFPPSFNVHQLDDHGDKKHAQYDNVDHTSPHTHVYLNKNDPKDYMIFRTINVHIRYQTHVVPIYAWCSVDKQQVGPVQINVLLKHVYRLWYVFDDTLYATSLNKDDVIHRNVWTTAHPEPWTPETSPLWLDAVTTGFKHMYTKAKKVEEESVASAVGRLFVHGNHVDWSEITASCSVKAKQNNTASANIHCVHLAYDIQTFVDIQREVQPSSKLQNLKALESYQQTGAITDHRA